jgi:hypothetical protein
VGIVSGVRGELLRGAREQQRITMRWISSHGGPSPAYQSEVERGFKSEVTHGVLSKWTQLLNITTAFARGELPRYRSEPAKCRGLAGEIAAVVSQDEFRATWPACSPLDRARHVLCLIADRSHNLPRIVLAHVMDVHLIALDDMMLGRADIEHNHLRAIITLTTLSEQFFKFGVLEDSGDANLIDLYLPAMRFASQGGVTPEMIIDFIRRQGPDQPPPDAPRNKRKR